MSKMITHNKCGDCRNYFKCDSACKNDFACADFKQQGKTVFDTITASPEVLAEKLVYITVTAWGETVYISTIIRDAMFRSRSEAIAATVARLKEVYNG